MVCQVRLRGHLGSQWTEWFGGIPRWLSGFGIVAIIMIMAACVLALFSGNRITSYIPLAFPIFLQEMVLAVWLIMKGFNPSVSAAGLGRRT